MYVAMRKFKLNDHILLLHIQKLSEGTKKKLDKKRKYFLENTENQQPRSKFYNEDIASSVIQEVLRNIHEKGTEYTKSYKQRAVITRRFPYKIGVDSDERTDLYVAKLIVCRKDQKM